MDPNKFNLLLILRNTKLILYNFQLLSFSWSRRGENKINLYPSGYKIKLVITKKVMLNFERNIIKSNLGIIRRSF